MNKLERDTERIERIRRALAADGFDAFVCALPSNVLLMTGYFPVIGTSIAVATREGETILLVPEDERELAERSWTDELKTFQPSSLEKLTTAAEATRQPLRDILSRLKLDNATIGFGSGPSFQPASYVSTHFYGFGLRDLLSAILPKAKLSSADFLLARLRAVLTPREIER